MLIKKLYNRICQEIWKYKRKKINTTYRRMIEGHDIPTIFSCNCMGGVMYHDLQSRFYSPTINMYMKCEDFIKFCENFAYYLSLEIETYTGHIKREYPICTLGDLTLFMVHYHTFEEARDKWNDRKQRIKADNIRIIATDRDGCTKELKQRFDQLPYKKVMFTHLPDDECQSSFYIQGYESDTMIGNLIEHDGKISGKRYYDQFNWVNFLIDA